MPAHIEIIFLFDCFKWRLRPGIFNWKFEKSKEYGYYWRWIKFWWRLCSISILIFPPSISSSPKRRHYHLNNWYYTDIKRINIFKFTEREVDELVLTQLIITYILLALPKLIIIIFHLALAKHRIPSTPTLFDSKSIFVYINLVLRVYPTVSWRDGALPRFQSDCGLNDSWLTNRYPFDAMEGCSREILTSHVPNIIIVWIR
jgi:hypothetical protein